MSIFKEKLNQFLNMLFCDQFSCILCNSEINPDRFGLCPDCALTKLEDEYKPCLSCGTPINKASLSDYCLDCPADRGFTLARSALIYDEVLHGLIHRFKFGNAEWLSKYLSPYIIDLYLSLNLDCDVIVPVPLCNEKFKSRGFNQSESLANALSAEINLPIIADALIKTHTKEDQARLSRAERLSNLSGVYSVNQEVPLKNKRVLLVDDVMTTGATAEVCSKELIKSGAKKIYVLTLATPIKKIV